MSEICFIEKLRVFNLSKKESWQISKFGTDKIPGECINIYSQI